MTIREGFGAVLSWFEKWRPSIWMTDARTDDLQLELQVAREGWKEARKDVEHLRADARHATEEVVRWKQTAIDRVLEIGRLQAEPDKLREQMRIDREAQKRVFLEQEETIRNLSEVQPEERKKLNDRIIAITADRDKWKALAESRDHEINKLNREYAELHARIEEVATKRVSEIRMREASNRVLDYRILAKLENARKERNALRAKLAAIEERNGPVWDHPEYRKVARRLRDVRKRLEVASEMLRSNDGNGAWKKTRLFVQPETVYGTSPSTAGIKMREMYEDGPEIIPLGIERMIEKEMKEQTQYGFNFGPKTTESVRVRFWQDGIEKTNEPVVVLFGVQAFGPFENFATAQKWAAQSDIGSSAKASFVTLTKPEFDEEPTRDEHASGNGRGSQFSKRVLFKTHPEVGAALNRAQRGIDADAKREQERATLDTICGVKSPLPTVQFGEIGATGHGC